MSEHFPECPGSWGVGDMPDGECPICPIVRKAYHRGYKDGTTWYKRVSIDYGHRKYHEGVLDALKAVKSVPWDQGVDEATDLGRADGIGKSILAIRRLLSWA